MKYKTIRELYNLGNQQEALYSIKNHSIYVLIYLYCVSNAENT